MKNLLIILTALTLISSVSSCTKPEKKIVGTWTLNSIIESNCDDPSLNGPNTNLSTNCDNTTEEFCYETTIVFRDDNTFKENRRIVLPDQEIDDMETDGGTYTYDGTLLEICYTQNSQYCETIEFIIDGDLATTTYPADEFTGCVTTYTSSKL